MTINELITKRARAWENAKQFLDAHTGENGTMSAEDAATYERMEAEINDLTKQIERMQRLNDMESTMKQPTSNPITGKPMNGDPENVTGRASKQYVKDMLTALRTEFRQVSNVLEEGNDANGGYLVPEEWDSRLIDTLDEENIMRRLGTRITTSGEHKINMAGTKPAASWIAEGGALTFGDATFAQKLLGDGIAIEPCIPSSWDKFTITKVFRGKELNITVENPKGVQSGVIRCVVNGAEVEGSFIAEKILKAENNITVVMG